ncbi:MAG: response regulator [Lachnospiraceae bacterium]|nr:response regulator [Lachnospiraceae bacterium]
MRRIEHYNILLADDEHYLRQSLARKIAELDQSFKVVCEAGDGRAALKALSENDIQVVFTDIRMPEMDGLALSSEISRRYPDMVIIILSGYADFEYAKQAIRCGVFEYLLKPVSEEELSGVLSRTSLRLQELYELPEENGAAGKSIEEACSYLEQYMIKNFREDIDFGALAEQFGFTSAYLSKSFTRALSESPSRYLTGLRMEEAKRLLSSTNESIARVGELSGYPDQFYFSRTFRKEVGENPSEYRKRTRGD